MKLPSKVKNIAGMSFGRLTAMSFVGLRPSGEFSRAMWLCVCECGKETAVAGTDLRCGNTKSCGCLADEARTKSNLKHGHCRGGDLTGAMRSWRSMVSRCGTKTNIGYADYGGRGISVCPEWLSFETFYADMGDRPEGHSIERINPDGNYCPENCAWIPMTRQARNTRTTVWVMLNGQRMCLADAAEKIGKSRQLVWDWLRKTRVPHGISLELAP